MYHYSRGQVRIMAEEEKKKFDYYYSLFLKKYDVKDDGALKIAFIEGFLTNSCITLKWYDPTS